jgi:hypothetical protein
MRSFLYTIEISVRQMGGSMMPLSAHFRTNLRVKGSYLLLCLPWPKSAFFNLQLVKLKNTTCTVCFVLWPLYHFTFIIMFVGFKAARLQIHANFHENFENVLEWVILWSNQKEAIYTLSMALTTHVNYQTVVKICLNSLYCAVEI